MTHISLENDIVKNIDTIVSIYNNRIFCLDVFYNDADAVEELVIYRKASFEKSKDIIERIYEKEPIFIDENDIIGLFCVQISVIIITFQTIFESDLYPYGIFSEIFKILNENYKMNLEYKQISREIISDFFHIMDLLEWHP